MSKEIDSWLKTNQVKHMLFRRTGHLLNLFEMERVEKNPKRSRRGQEETGIIKEE